MNQLPYLMTEKATLINFIILIMESFIAIMSMKAMKYLIIKDNVLSLYSKMTCRISELWTYV